MFKLKFKHYIQIALFFLVTLVLVFFFAYLIGDYNPLSKNTVRYDISFNYASGLRRGAPVRLAGVDIGKVKKVTLHDNEAEPVRVEIEVNPSASYLIKHKTQAFINVAGLMGETYLELSMAGEEVERAPAGTKVQILGVDPPRLDQLMYEALYTLHAANELIGHVQPEMSTFIEELKSLLKGLNETLGQLTKKEKKAFAKKVIQLVSNLESLTSGLSSENANAIVQHIQNLLKKADLLNEQNIRKFLQKEGIRAKVF